MKKKVYYVQLLEGTRISIKEDTTFFTTDGDARLIFLRNCAVDEK